MATSTVPIRRCCSCRAVRPGGTWRRWPHSRPTTPPFQPGFEDADTSVIAAIGLNGYYGNYYGQGSGSSPLAYVRPDAPPFFLAHGDHDTVVPVDNARHFADKLRGVSTNPVVYAELPGAQHAFDLLPSLRFEMVVDAIEAFAAWVRSREVRSGHDPRLDS
jgi:acetyl esterase/lipase